MGLYYLESRYYDPRIRRFISPDNIDYLEPTSFSGLNLYAYCEYYFEIINYSNCNIKGYFMFSQRGHQGNMKNSKYLNWTIEELIIRYKELCNKRHLTDEEKKDKKDIETELKARKYRNRSKRMGYNHSLKSSIIINDGKYIFDIGNITLQPESIAAMDIAVLIFLILSNDITGIGVIDDLALVALIPLFIILNWKDEHGKK